MEGKKFQRRVEDFVCEKCGHKTKGTGYTNHCCQCLWSKHLDVNPGDRLALCHGMMEPIGIDQKDSQFILKYKCHGCGKMIKNQTAPEDNMDEIIKLSSTPSKK
jgi:hypothetical protein